jgi:hypothetical protein
MQPSDARGKSPTIMNPMGDMSRLNNAGEGAGTLIIPTGGIDDR